MSYGFALTTKNENCCKCFEARWTSGSARGKTMVVQAINVAAVGGDVKENDLVVLTPGGGAGPNSGGCPAQYGRNYNWCVFPFHSQVWSSGCVGWRKARGS